MTKKFYLISTLVSVASYIFMLIFGMHNFIEFEDNIILATVIFVIDLVIFFSFLQHYNDTFQIFFAEHNFNILVIILIILYIGCILYTIFYLTGFNQIMLFSILTSTLNVTIIFYIYLRNIKKEK